LEALMTTFELTRTDDPQRPRRGLDDLHSSATASARPHGPDGARTDDSGAAVLRRGSPDPQHATDKYRLAVPYDSFGD
jgi:hypothetical protein